MKKIYVLSSGLIPENWESTLKEIYDVDPDEIFLLSNTEVNLIGNWNDLLDPLQSWLEINNKFATLVTPQYDDMMIRPNIKTEQSYAMLESVYKLFVNSPALEFNFDKLYCSYMYRSDEARGRLLDTMISKNLLDSGYVTYHQPEIKTHESFGYYNKHPLKYEEENYSKDSVFHFVRPIFYEKSFVDIVAETSFSFGNFFITEKTLRPIFHKKPFLTLGPLNFYKDYFIKLFGLDLYDEIFDYSFDQESDLQDRIDGLLINVEKIKSMSFDDLNKLYMKVKPKLDHNRQVLEDIYNDIYKIVPRCMHTLLDGAYQYKLYGLHQVSMMDLIKNYNNGKFPYKR